LWKSFFTKPIGDRRATFFASGPAFHTTRPLEGRSSLARRCRSRPGQPLPAIRPAGPGRHKMSESALPERVSSAAAPAARRLDGKPAVPDLLPTAVAQRPGRGTKRDQRAAVSLRMGFVPRRHPTSTRRPSGRSHQEEESPDDRPAREPCLAPGLRGVSGAVTVPFGRRGRRSGRGRPPTPAVACLGRGRAGRAAAEVVPESG
jgi:hypothetical protein